MKERKIKRKIIGTPNRPRFAVFKSARHLQAQIIDDQAGRTLASVSTLEKDVRSGLEKTFANIAAAKHVGKIIAERAQKSGVTQVVFDRAGNRYHGALKALADSAREGGLQF